jgi:hypothetical protein
LIAFGGLAGLEESIEEDNNLKVRYYTIVIGSFLWTLIWFHFWETAPITCFQKMPIDFGKTMFSVVSFLERS